MTPPNKDNKEQVSYLVLWCYTPEDRWLPVSKEFKDANAAIKYRDDVAKKEPHIPVKAVKIVQTIL